MRPDFEPEPTPEEREALETALARLLQGPAEARSAWWRRGLEEALDDDSDLTARAHRAEAAGSGGTPGPGRA